ncbi:MAG: hypothetical protein LBH74_03690 [Nitrososphaerota archaeon]|nr:hypothetical protein [Nitrososphaerota archaeon]
MPNNIRTQMIPHLLQRHHPNPSSLLRKHRHPQNRNPGADILDKIASPIKFLTQYYYRNLSESGFSADKRRFGGLIKQKRKDRQKTVMLTKYVFSAR